MRRLAMLLLSAVAFTVLSAQANTQADAPPPPKKRVVLKAKPITKAPPPPAASTGGSGFYVGINHRL